MTTTTTKKHKKSDGKSSVRVRMYRVGFGDFFLVTVPTSGGPRHILVDCGVHAGDIGTISDAVDDMAKETGKHLSLVVATHRHADHISGFATCADRFRDFTVDAVWMSWWDDPSNPDATSVQNGLAGLAARVQSRLALRAAGDERTERALKMVTNLTGATAAAGDGTLRGNDAALAMLRGTPASDTFRFASTPVCRYFKAGDTADLPKDLAAAGLVARVLGPPIDAGLVAKMNNASQQYLQLAGGADGDGTLRPFDLDWEVTAAAHPASSKEIELAVRAVQPDALVAAAQKADNSINNQSLVLHFTFKGKTLLFVGDAQWGNWANFLFGGDVSGGQGATPLLPASRDLLAAIDFYKVGHHGSTNATPIDAVAAMREGCAAMCSTEPDCYGSPDKGSEVPRIPLLDALSKQTKNRLVRSDQIAAGTHQPTAGLPADVPTGFSTPKNLYVDFTI